MSRQLASHSASRTARAAASGGISVASMRSSVQLRESGFTHSVVPPHASTSTRHPIPPSWAGVRARMASMIAHGSRPSRRAARFGVVVWLDLWSKQ